MNKIRYELQHVIKATESTVKTNLIKATQSFLSRNETTGSSTKPDQFDKNEEEKQLIAFIKQNSRLLILK